MKRIFFAILVVASTAACAVSENTISSQERREMNTFRTKSSMTGVSPADSVRMVYEAQTSKSALLQSLVMKKDGTWVLAINKEQAMSLGIPSDLYDNYAEYVSNLNQ